MKLSKIIPYGRQSINADDISSVKESLQNDFLTTGKYVKKFERKIISFTKARFAISCSSATSGLHLAFLAIDLKKNDVVIMPAINFIAAYNIAKYMGAKIYLADVDSLSGQMTPQSLLNCINVNNLKKIKTVVTMYLGGYPENVEEFYKIKKKLNFYLIEDACHALGAKYSVKKKKFHIGSCKHSDIAVFSLHPVKTITAGEGGVVTTNSKSLARRILLLRSHGIVRNKIKHWSYDVNFIGFNYRLSDINCALALSQMQRIKNFINKRYRIYKYYRKRFFQNKNIDLPNYNLQTYPSCHLFIISFKGTKKIKENILLFLKKNKIRAQYHYIPIYKFKVFNHQLVNNVNFVNSEKYYNSTISLPIFYDLSMKKCNFICDKIKFYLTKST